MSGSTIQGRHAFAVALGLTDGILTALTLAAGRITDSTSKPSLALALKIATASALAGGVVFFTAELSRRNHELVRAEQQLNLLSRGYLATTRLGHFALMESSVATLIAIVSNFIGALTPFLVGMMVEREKWVPVCCAIFLLGVLGFVIAKMTYRSKLWWTACLVFAGFGLAELGLWLRIV